MLPLKEYLTLDGWIKDWEETSAKGIGHILGVDLIYTTWCSTAAGFGNALKELFLGESFSEGFWQASYNHFTMALFGNLIHPIANSYFRKSKHRVRDSNIFLTVTAAAYITGHYIAGTDNPISAMAPPIVAAFIMTNSYIFLTKNKDENKIET
jgi:hypothetical protein